MAKLEMFEGLELPAAADFHVHLRDGPMMQAVTPTVRRGGVDTVFVMPNLVPPITTVEAALAYKKRLQTVEPNVNYLMSLYLHPDISPDTVREAKSSGQIYGIKSYPAGVTTNSASGVVDYEAFYDVFRAMEECDLVLNLHGEAPPTPPTGERDGSDAVTVLNAEERFLPTLADLHRRFPKLRIVLEHCTTAKAVEAVRRCGPNVVGTITAHHLFLTVDDWAGDPINFCKPVAKLPSDRVELLRAVVDGSGKFFFGSDSAPHLLNAKMGLTDGGLGAGKCAAGVFTQPNAIGFVLESIEQAVEVGIVEQNAVTNDVVTGVLGGYGRKFYKIGEPDKKIRIVGKGVEIKNVRVTNLHGNMEEAQGMADTVVTFRSGKNTYGVEWL
ncbi:dihydroorotase [Neophaeococcomyces mojaviensis]|uniref:Dihydroorotase n=1 Tax=Neophaeococcomyces mojaviensis TaxID=3383035 RepID=A0ACC3AB45_9EURO|nr:dihydroorotase [Knufia sp. JES_112]